MKKVLLITTLVLAVGVFAGQQLHVVKNEASYMPPDAAKTTGTL